MIKTSRRMRSAQDMLAPVEQRMPLREQPAMQPPATAIVETSTPWDIRLLGWFGYQLGTPKRILRMILWAFRLWVRWYMKGRLFAVAMLGPRVDKGALRLRMAACAECEHRDGKYCSACKCGKWPLARLTVKNRLLRWQCPHQKHSGTYVRWANQRSGCAGCGSAKRQEPGNGRYAATRSVAYGS